jgi:hypothetical protein
MAAITVILDVEPRPSVRRYARQTVRVLRIFIVQRAMRLLEAPQVVVVCIVVMTRYRTTALGAGHHRELIQRVVLVLPEADATWRSVIAAQHHFHFVVSVGNVFENGSAGAHCGLVSETAWPGRIGISGRYAIVEFELARHAARIILHAVDRTRYGLHPAIRRQLPVDAGAIRVDDGDLPAECVVLITQSAVDDMIR